MRKQWRLYVLALSFALGATSNAFGQGPAFTSIDYPGAAPTIPWGFNTRGDIVGFYTAAGVTHGFLLSGGQYTAIDSLEPAVPTSVGSILRATWWESTHWPARNMVFC
ncbi:MAG: hypothetical protein ACR2NN_23950 [Bryobacteraceae bacterium]